MSATLKQALDRIATATAWSRTDLGHRVRWCQEAGLIKKGRPGAKRAGAHRATVDDLVTMLLSTACPEGKAAPKWVPVFANLKTEDRDGNTFTLRDKLIKYIQIYRKAFADYAQVEELDFLIDRILLIFDEKRPTAEIDIRPSSESEHLRNSYRLEFLPDPDPAKAEIKLLGRYNRATVIDGGIFAIIADLLRDDVWESKE